jgi:hypothetical protein
VNLPHGGEVEYYQRVVVDRHAQRSKVRASRSRYEQLDNRPLAALPNLFASRFAPIQSLDNLSFPGSSRMDNLMKAHS